MSQTINIFNCLWWLFVFGMFSIFLKMRVIGICSFWSFIRRFILHFWDFYQCRNIICSVRKNFSYTIPWALFLWCHTNLWIWVTCWQHKVSRQGRMTINRLWWKGNMFWCIFIWIYWNFIFVDVYWAWYYKTFFLT